MMVQAAPRIVAKVCLLAVLLMMSCVYVLSIDVWSDELTGQDKLQSLREAGIISSTSELDEELTRADFASNPLAAT